MIIPLFALFLALQSAPRHQVLGYYVPYDATSWRSLQAHPEALDIVGAQWVSIDACGGIGSRDDRTLKLFARKNGLRLVPSLLTLSGWLNHRLLTDAEVSPHAIEQIVAYTLTEDYDGFDLDLEGVDAADRDALSAFVAELGSALHEQGKLLTLAIPAKDRDVRIGWAGAYDYAALGASADLITVMAYEYRGPFSGPGSVAPYAWVDRVAAYASQQMPADRVLLGLAFYGYDWNTTSGGTRSLGYPQAAALADQYGVAIDFDADSQSATFTYEREPADPGATGFSALPPAGHQIVTRQPPPCDAVAPEAPSPTRVPLPPPDVPQSHEVWVEDVGSAVARMDLTDRYAIAGIATWRLGLEDPRIWPALHDWRN